MTTKELYIAVGSEERSLGLRVHEWIYRSPMKFVGFELSRRNVHERRNTKERT